MEPSRRDLLELTVRAAALPGAAAFFSQLVRGAETHQHGQDAPPEPPLLSKYTPKFFDAQDFEALRSFTAILIPTDDTPGAREAHCAAFIDFVLNSAEGFPEMQKPWRDAMLQLRSVGFHSSAEEHRATLIDQMSEPERKAGVAHPAFDAYRLIKSQTTFAYFTSRAGMIEMLDYRGNSYNPTFPACQHPEHQTV